jgi:uncharacterized protein (TIGR02996 family)
MSRLEDLRAAIREDLDADEPRLVYADALQAVGDPRGELIAIQCELARLGCDRTRVALWGCPEYLRRSMSLHLRRDWIGDALAHGDPKHIARLRTRERAILEVHEKAWSEDLPEGYRFGRGFIDHVYGGRNPDVVSLFERAPFMRSLELELQYSGKSVFALSELVQLRQLRVRTIGADDSDAFLARAGALPHLRELAIHGLSRVSGRPGHENTPWEGPALDAFLSSPLMHQLDALDLYDQQIDRPERIDQLFAVAKLRDLRLGMGSGSERICGALARQPRAASLEILDLSYSGVDQELAAVATASHLQNLRALRVGEPLGLTCFDQGARAIGDSLPELRVLDLEFNPFERYLQDLVGGRGLAALTHLGLHACS